MYANLGRWSYRKRRLVVVFWVGLLVLFNIAAAIIGPAYNNSPDNLDSESDQGFAILRESFPGAGAQLSGSIVYQADRSVADPEVQSAMEQVFHKVAALEDVDVVSPYSPAGAQQIAPSGDIAFATVNLAQDYDQTEAQLLGGEIELLIEETLGEDSGITTEVGGQALAEFEPPETEFIGIAFAIVILIVAFGSVMAMGLPIGVALAGVGTGIAITQLISNLTTVPDFANLIGVMIGLGVGIDYALFIVTRYRKAMKEGLPGEDAIAHAMDTAGRAVVFAGLTVVLSLLGLLLIGLSFATGLGVAAGSTVAVTMLASITLLPALLGFAQHRVEVTRYRGLIAAGFVSLALFGVGIGVPAVAAIGGLLAVVVLVAGFVVKPLQRLMPERTEKPLRDTLAYRWSRMIQARPWAFLVLGGGLLLLLSLPVANLRLGFSDEGNLPEETTTRKAYELVTEGFGPGFNSPMLLASTVEGPADIEVVAAVGEAIAADPGIAAVSPPLPSNMEDPASSEAFLLQIIPTTSAQDAATEDLVSRLRSDVIPSVTNGTGVDANLTGVGPTNIDFTDFMASRSLLFFAVVLLVSFMLLMAVFRSVLVPIKAVILNMLSISAAYGVVVALFQWGWFGSITGIEPAPIEPFVPMMMFAIVFGLSMDYEVFLLSRIKEEFDATGDAVNSVADGLASTARVITAAAAIMTVVFGSFLLEDNRIIKLFGLGLSMAVLLDATLVRMLLVPATMELLGKRNWWLPRWLDRLLPTINVEGGQDVVVSH